MTLDQLRILVTVVQAGSFTAAAERLATQKSYVSRVLAALEAELGVKLLERTTRSLSVTEAGTAIYERALAILAAVEDTEQIAQSLHGEPRGTLRLTCGVEFGMLAVIDWIDTFLARHPQATVEAEYTSRVLDVVHEGFDVAVRVGPVQESRLVARQLGEIEYGLFACPRYLKQHGTPATPDALRQHALVMFTGGQHKRGWLLTHRETGESARIDGPARLAVNHSFAVREALLRSHGIGVLPLLVAHEALVAGRLVPVLPAWPPAAVPVHAVYPSARYLSPKVRAFIDIALERFPRAADDARAAQGKACRPVRRAAAAAPPPPPIPVSARRRR